MIHPAGTERLDWTGRAPSAQARPLAEAVHIAVHADLAAVEGVWRAFKGRAVRSIYQRFDWVSTWQEHAGRAEGVTAAIVVGTLRGETAFILPLGRWRHGPLRAAGWLGGSHVNINLGLYDPEFLRLLSPADVPELMRRVALALKPVDFLDLADQPRLWDGHLNPLALLPGAIDAQPVLAMRLDRDFDAVVDRGNGARRRKKLRWQDNTLAPVGGYRFRRAASPEEAQAMLAAFLRHKAEQFKRAGMRNVFAEPGVPAFLASMAARAGGGDRLIDFYAIEIAGEIRATFAAGVDRGRLSGYFSAISQDEFTRVSPGDLLLSNLIRQSCAEGLTALDLGIGEERYETAWATEPEAHFSVFLPVTALGRLAVSSVAHWKALEYRVRSSRSLWEMVKKMRRATATAVPPPAAEG